MLVTTTISRGQFRQACHQDLIVSWLLLHQKEEVAAAGAFHIPHLHNEISMCKWEGDKQLGQKVKNLWKRKHNNEAMMKMARGRGEETKVVLYLPVLSLSHTLPMIFFLIFARDRCNQEVKGDRHTTLLKSPEKSEMKAKEIGRVNRRGWSDLFTCKMHTNIETSPWHSFCYWYSTKDKQTTNKCWLRLLWSWGGWGGGEGMGWGWVCWLTLGNSLLTKC